MKVFTDFEENISEAVLPERFTFPFNYVPHPLSIKAARQLQGRLNTLPEVANSIDNGYGKMFGVLVVKNQKGELGFLSAFSGKIDNKNIVEGFVPPIYDRLKNDGFFLREEEKLVSLTVQIEQKKNNEQFLSVMEELRKMTSEFEDELIIRKSRIRERKEIRREKRAQLTDLPELERENLERELSKESSDESRSLKRYKKEMQLQIELKQKEVDELREEIIQLKQARKKGSGELQKRLFEQYNLLSRKGKLQNLVQIFDQTALKIPPAGAGDCAAPKLLQYAYLNDLDPVCMAEFWWGPSPKMEVRNHGEYYPACRSKCEPILGHMLQGLEVEPNPIYVSPTEHLVIETLFEDDYLVVINKPSGLLSVPGKELKDSVAIRMKQNHPDSTGPMVAHRLDMSTSGIMLIAKSMEIYTALQKQFTDRSISKRYVALLEGEVASKEGVIHLPLRVDLDNRPRQLVDFEYGKSARTLYEVVETKNGQTRIHFFPITGRTHQLRVHAAHHQGLNAAIVGDDLYGKKGARLCLHADKIVFTHPFTKKEMSFNHPPEF